MKKKIYQTPFLSIVGITTTQPFAYSLAVDGNPGIIGGDTGGDPSTGLAPILDNWEDKKIEEDDDDDDEVEPLKLF